MQMIWHSCVRYRVGAFGSKVTMNIINEVKVKEMKLERGQ